MEAVQLVALSCMFLSWVSAVPTPPRSIYQYKELLIVQERPDDAPLTQKIQQLTTELFDVDANTQMQSLLASLPKQSSKLNRILDNKSPQSKFNVMNKYPTSKAIFGGIQSKSPHSPTEIISDGLNSTCPSNWSAPWHVGLMLLTDKKTSLCGGVLVHQRWVLTAAHCLDNVTRALVMVGSKDYHKGFLNGKGQVIAVDNFTIHENYRRESASQPALHDIALLRLQSDAVFGPDVSPAHIPKRNSALLASGTEMVISGWGSTKKSPTTQAHLQCARVPLVSHQVCERAYKSLGVNIRTSHVCAGYAAGGAGPCNGDSGGGLVHRGSNGNSTVIGIISWSLGCGSNYGVYTNVQKHRPWLLTNAPELDQKGQSFHSS